VSTAPATIDDLSSKLDALLERLKDGLPRYLTIGGSAAYTSISEESIRRLIAGGKLTALRPVKGRIVIDRFALDAYVLSCDSRPRTGRGRA
jgi:excisionase family DNA binding protein